MVSPKRRALRAEQFTTAAAVQPAWYRATNRVGRLFPRFGAITAEKLFARARKKHAGLGEPIPETATALDALLRSIDEEASLSFAGRIAAGMDCGRLAEQHLLIEKHLEDRPAILETELPPPIFMVGWMRSGSTYTHRLLARDPDTRTMPYWESMFPIPPEVGGDDRPDEVRHVLDQLAKLSPNYDAIHPMSADDVEECVALFTNVFRTLQFDCQYRVPGYVDWLMKQDPRVAYGQYRQQLQIVHHHRPVGKRFVLKDPTHSVFVETILELFPDARFIFTHRDPVVTLSSMASLYAYTRALFSDDVDPLEIGPALFESHLPETLERAIELTDALPPGRVAHVRQANVRSSPLEAMAAAYRDLGEELSDAARSNMQAFVDAERAAPRHAHIHSPEAFGLDREAIRRRLAGYCERFDL